MKMVIALALMPVLLAATACAASSGFGDMDIIGSKLSNIQIVSSYDDRHNDRYDKYDRYDDKHDRPADVENKLDIVGSRLDKIQIFSNNLDFGNTEIVGGNMSNVKITQYREHRDRDRDRDRCSSCKKSNCYGSLAKCYWDPACIDYKHNDYNKQRIPGLNSHLGVDAWYGCYWFNDQIYTPKWPQEY